MESALRIVDDFTATQVFRARDDTPYRPDPKRASLDLLCPACREIPADDYCPDHAPIPPQDQTETVPTLPGETVLTPRTAPPITPRTFILSGADATPA